MEEGAAGWKGRQQRAPGAPAMRSNMSAFVVVIGLTSSARGDTGRRLTGAIQAAPACAEQPIYALAADASAPTKMQG
jgi:hypothetical protein